MLSGEMTVNEPNGRHVLDAVIAIRRVVERSFLVDDPHGRLMRLDNDLLDILQSAGYLWRKCNRRFDRGLGMELGRERDLKEDMFHHVRSEGPLQDDFVPFEE